MDQANIKYERFRVLIEERYWDDRGVEEDRDTIHYRMKEMAVEVILSTLNDILSVKKLIEYIKLAGNKKVEKRIKLHAQLMIRHHVQAIEWLCSGKALNSIWFEILGFEEIGKKALMNTVHKRIEK